MFTIIRRSLCIGLLATLLFTAGLPITYAEEATIRLNEQEFKISRIGAEGRLLEEYRLSKYDVINILVLGFPDGIFGYSTKTKSSDNENSSVNDIMVGPDGLVQLPYAGTVKLAGLTLEEAKALLTEKLGQYIKIPDMSIMIKTYGPRKVYVMGEVKNPGIHELSIESMNVFAALSQAGGVDTHGRPRHVQVIRVIGDTMYYKESDMERYVKKHDINQNIALQDGDIVYIPTSNKIDLQEDVLPYISVYGLYRNLTRD